MSDPTTREQLRAYAKAVGALITDDIRREYRAVAATAMKRIIEGAPLALEALLEGLEQPDTQFNVFEDMSLRDQIDAAEQYLEEYGTSLRQYLIESNDTRDISAIVDDLARMFVMGRAAHLCQQWRIDIVGIMLAIPVPTTANVVAFNPLGHIAHVRERNVTNNRLNILLDGLKTIDLLPDDISITAYEFSASDPLTRSQGNPMVTLMTWLNIRRTNGSEVLWDFWVNV